MRDFVRDVILGITLSDVNFHALSYSFYKPNPLIGGIMPLMLNVNVAGYLEFPLKYPVNWKFAVEAKCSVVAVEFLMIRRLTARKSYPE